jgi:hypothetical protein
LQAKANSVPTAGLKELPGGAAAQQQQQQRHTLLSKLLQVAGLNPSSSSKTPAIPAATAAAATQQAGLSPSADHLHASSPLLQTNTPYQQPAIHHLAQQQQQQQQESRTDGDIAAAALGLIRRLRLGLADKVECILRREFEEVWLDVVCRKPPWKDGDFLHVLHKHWRSALQVRLGGVV